MIKYVKGLFIADDLYALDNLKRIVKDWSLMGSFCAVAIYTNKARLKGFNLYSIYTKQLFYTIDMEKGLIYEYDGAGNTLDVFPYK